MGYRHYLAIVETEKLKSVTEEMINKHIQENADEGEDGFLAIYDFIEKDLQGDNIYELGKYSDVGDHLESKDTSEELESDLRPIRELIKKYANNSEHGFNVLTKEDLIYCINAYKDKVLQHITDLTHEKSEDEYDKRTMSERQNDYIKEKIFWFGSGYVDIKEKNKYSVQGTWLYEYGVFDLVHSLKMIDWEKYTLVVYAW